MRRWPRYLFIATVLAMPVSVSSAIPAAAECTNANGITVCAQGDVRGAEGGSGPGVSGPVVPYPCEYDWYCGDDALDIIVNPGPPGLPDLGRPGRPGGGGIGPR